MLIYRLVKYTQTVRDDNNYACCHWAGNGPVAELEEKLCSLYGAKHALCVDSATNGLLYLILAYGLNKREIMTTPLSFGGTIAGALSVGCTFSFTDVDYSLNIDPMSVLEVLKMRPKTKAIIAVDYGGNPHQMKAIHAICKEHGLIHIVDAAQSLGAKYPHENIAAYNDAMVVSFGAGKAISSGGEGGAIITNNSELYEKLLSTCQHAHRQERDLGIGVSHEFALNGRIHPIAALFASENFQSGLLEKQRERELYLGALSILGSFDSVSSTFFQQDSAFYHCPFLVKDADLLETEFKESDFSRKYYITKPTLQSLPSQLIKLGLKRKIKYSYSPWLDDNLNNIFFFKKNR